MPGAVYLHSLVLFFGFLSSYCPHPFFSYTCLNGVVIDLPGHSATPGLAACSWSTLDTWLACCSNWVRWVLYLGIRRGHYWQEAPPQPPTPGPSFFQPLPSLLCACSWQSSWPVTMMKTFTSSTPLTVMGPSMLRDIRVTEITPQVRLSFLGFYSPGLLAWRTIVSHSGCTNRSYLKE